MAMKGTLTILHSFDESDGYAPEAALVQGSDGSFYGTTSASISSSSCEFGCGTIFKEIFSELNSGAERVGLKATVEPRVT
jgi:hypothetical protein